MPDVLESKKKQRKAMEVSVSLPSKIALELVQADAQRNYEIFQWLLVIVAPIATGFWTAYFTTDRSRSLWWSSIAFTAITALFIALAAWRRRRLYGTSVTRKATFDDFR